ncbi:putative serine esterase DUF676 [Agrobacterium vitis]|nr:putative serine esterase DUF676 [Agrobacterium vitis]
MSSSSTLFSTISATNGNTDVIFVHGLSGDAQETWTNEESPETEGGYWPKWLASDIPHLNLYSLGYPASIFAKWAKKEMNLYERAKNVLDTLANNEIGSRPVIFICHSLGGILVKQILRTAIDSLDDDWKKIDLQCKGIFFIATPHSGSSLASILSTLLNEITSPVAKTLENDSAELTQLNESFRARCFKSHIEVHVYYEMHKTKKSFLVVDMKSADPGVNGVMPVAIEADHQSICKPHDRNSFLYSTIKRHIKKMAPTPPRCEDYPEEFPDDELEEPNPNDRRELLEKMIAAGREHEYPQANDSQNKFARPFIKNGLKTKMTSFHKELLADIETRFKMHVFNPLICKDADETSIANSIQINIIDPLTQKYNSRNATSKTIVNAMYYLTEQCHIRWDKP